MMDADYRPPKVWVIDDAKLDSIIIKLSIQKIYKDAQVKLISNGNAAIELLVELAGIESLELPDVLLLDLDMPGMNGWEFLDQLKSLNIESLRRVQVFIVSGTISPTDVKKSLSDPFVTNYFHKPIGLDTLRSIFEAERSR
jgi:CheY-like chemotaxis protein